MNHGRDILFLLDHSGSMNGPRMTSAKLGLQGCLGMLEPLDCFQIVVFDDMPTQLAGVLADGQFPELPQRRREHPRVRQLRAPGRHVKDS